MRISEPFGSFSIGEIPQQPRIAWCHSFFVNIEDRGKGLAHQLKRAQKMALQDHNYDYALCTIDGANHTMKNVQIQAGWVKLAEFPNRTTGGTTEIWGCPVVSKTAKVAVPKASIPQLVRSRMYQYEHVGPEVPKITACFPDSGLK